MRGWPKTLLVVATLLAGPARAHPAPARTDDDRWLRSGTTVAAFEVEGDPEPCGPPSGPSILPVHLLEPVDGEPVGGAEAVLLGPRVQAPAKGARVLLVLRETLGTDGAGCATVPRLTVDALPSPPVDFAEDPEGWAAYARALRALAPGDRDGHLALWAETLARPGERLAQHAETALASAGRLPETVIARLATFAADAEAPERTRLAALRLSAARLPLAALAERCDDASLPVSETAMGALLARSPAGEADAAEAAARLAQVWSQAPEGERPADEIRRAGLAATLAALGDARGRETLTAGLEDRLFKVRAFAMEGLAHLAAEGDAAALGALRARLRREPDARLTHHLQTLVEAATPVVPAKEAPSARTGLRMLLVLGGLLALAGMVVLPRLVERRRAPRP